MHVSAAEPAASATRMLPSYADLAGLIRARFTDPTLTLRELFARITFNILTGNNDDHACNHAAFWDGTALILTPAYDICPTPRAGGETAQIMAIGKDGYRMSQVAGCVARASTYLLSEGDAREIVDHQIDVIETQWNEVCNQQSSPRSTALGSGNGNSSTLTQLRDTDRGRIQMDRFCPAAIS